MIHIIKYLEKSEKIISKNKTILLLLYIIMLLITLYLKYYKYSIQEGNTVGNFKYSIEERKKKLTKKFLNK